MKKEQNHKKNSYAAIVLIPTLIAALVFYIARALFAAPEVLLGTAQPVIAVLCVIAGILLLLPLFITIVAALVTRISAKVRINELCSTNAYILEVRDS